MFMVSFINFGYRHDNFDSLEAALAYARNAGFESNIYDGNNRLVASFHPLRGVTYRTTEKHEG
mgnify:CR=1 FL=1